MSSIEIVSASAGTGKTFHITRVLQERIQNKSIRPEKVVATTFTIKAAAELAERVRRALLSKDMVDEARALQAARVGTVHAICAELIQDYAFEAGLSPQLRIIDELDARVLLDKVLDEVVDEERHGELMAITRRMDNLEWDVAVRELVERARTNRVDGAALRGSIPRSTQGAAALFGDPAEDGAHLDQALRDALETFCRDCDTEVDRTKKTAAVLDFAETMRQKLRRNFGLRWREWVKLAKSEPGKASRDLYAPVVAAAAAHDRHPGLHQDVRRSIELVLGAAAGALERYEQRKRDRGVLDFADLEAYGLDLLEREDVRDRLRDEIDLFLVDEFQDTSPIQLAIFARLAELARESIWVGDQKQAIYGFRGTDPALMDAALQALYAERAPETLAESWRTLPELVDATSGLFARAFPQQGIPADRVRIQATDKKPWPTDLGPVFERWTLQSRNREADVGSLVTCVTELIADASVRVRDVETDEPRPVRLDDIAILCRKNDVAEQVAYTLGEHGVPADTARPGLLDTSEAQCALAAVRLFLDPGDRLARATLSRYFMAENKPQAWLNALGANNDGPFAELAEVRAVMEAGRCARPTSAVAAFDSALKICGLDELCRRWGDAERRRRNLELLRIRAERYERVAGERGRACTPAGLLLFLEGLDDGASQAPLSGTRAVHVGTWHTAKGLEWPIVVLFELDSSTEPTALGVQVEPSAEGFDLRDPLRGRWLRFWPQPYHPANNDQPFHQRLSATIEDQRAKQGEERQSLRLLYVGWTRARDRLVLAARPGALTNGILGQLRDENGVVLMDDDGHWAGDPTRIHERDGVPAAAQAVAAGPSAGPPLRTPVEHPAATLRPSELEGAGSVGEPIQIGERIPISGKVNMARLGDAVHAFLAADNPEVDSSLRRELARGLLRRFDCASAVEPLGLVTASDNLCTWVAETYPDATWKREWPVLASTREGTMLRGAADLVLETSRGVVVVDHKSFPGTKQQSVARAARYSGQLAAYGDAVARATGATDVACFVHLPMLGLLLPVADRVSVNLGR